MNDTTLILASASPRRVQLLQEIWPDLKVVPSDTAELHNEQLTARELAKLNAYRKARSVAKRFPDALVLGADTLVYLDGELLGKPVDLADAQRMLERLAGKTHEVVTGVCLLHLRAHREQLFAESSYVTFKRLNSQQICRYLTLVETRDKAGAYAIQEQGDMIVRGIEGSYSNVVGLPVERLKAELEAWKRHVSSPPLA